MSEFPEKRTRKNVSLAAVFAVMRPDFRETVVQDALQAKAPRNLRDPLNTAIRARIKINGFRDASKAHPTQLFEPVLHEMELANGKLAGAVLRVWEHSHAELRDHVTAYLEAAAVAPIGPDYKNGKFKAGWPTGERERHREAVAGQHPDLDQEEVGLMLCLVAGRSPFSQDFSTALNSEVFARFISVLGDLPPTAPDWKEADAFRVAVGELAALKAKDRINDQTRAVERAIEYIRENHKEDVKYLGLEVGFWFNNVKARQDLAPKAMRFLGKLQEELDAYGPIRPQGASLEEEKRRAPRRAEHEAAILGIANEWEALAATPPPKPAAEAREERAVYGMDTSPGSPRRRADDGSKLKALKSELADVKALHKEETDGFRFENNQLSSEISDLKKQLNESRTSESYWRDLYVAEKGRRETEGGEEADAATVKEAVDRAKDVFDTELVVALNSKSNTAKPFEKPQEVLHALHWLATEFRRQRLNPGSSPDFNLAIKEACPGWFYKAHQTQTTKGMFSEWYKTTVNGKTYDLSNHIGKGNSFDPVSTIRIAFAWDEQTEQVVVGFIGPHQRNRQS